MNNNSVQVVKLVIVILELIRIFVHCRVHVLFHVKLIRILHLLHNLPSKNVEPLDSGNQNTGSLVDCEAFCRVLFGCAFGTQILVVLSEVVNGAELLERFFKSALLVGLATWQRDVESKSFVKGVGLVVAV